MADFHATFSVNNQTGQKIHDLTVTHEAGSSPVGKIDLSTLDDNATSAKAEFTSDHTHHDEWSVEFKLEEGQQRIGHVRCAIRDHKDSGQNVTIVLHLETFDIIPPSSSACRKNKYN